MTVHRVALRRPFEIIDRGKTLATRVGAFDGARTLHVRVVAHDVHAVSVALALEILRLATRFVVAHRRLVALRHFLGDAHFHDHAAFFHLRNVGAHFLHLLHLLRRHFRHALHRVRFGGALPQPRLNRGWWTER